MTTTHNLAAQFAKRKISKHKQKGNGLLYALLGMALLAIGGYYAFSIYQDKSLSASVESDIQNVQDTIQMTQRLFGQNNDYAAQTTATLIQAGAIPPRLRIAATNTAMNSFGQLITASPATITNNADVIRLSWPVPRAACAELATAIQGAARGVSVSGQGWMKPNDGVFSGAAAAALCDVSATPIINIDIGRFAAVAR